MVALIVLVGVLMVRLGVVVLMSGESIERIMCSSGGGGLYRSG